MTYRIQTILANKVAQALTKLSSPATAATYTEGATGASLAHDIIRHIRINSKRLRHNKVSTTNFTHKNFHVGTIGVANPSSNIPLLEYEVSLRKLHHTFPCIPSNGQPHLESFGSELLQRLETDTSSLIGTHLEPNPKSKDVILRLTAPGLPAYTEVLRNVVCFPHNFWKSSALLSTISHENVVLEYSSPNIAKPFHVGHLRSTILGHCLSQLHAALGHNITRLNYLGDWGTQFGLLRYGFSAKGLSRSDLQDDAIRKLYDVYVWANKAAEEDPSVTEKAKEIFACMEAGDEQELDMWRFFKDISVKDLESTYASLGISFDSYHGESQYGSEQCRAVLLEMEQRDLLKQHPDGRKMFEHSPGQQVTVVKSDGTTIYLSRDIAAAVDRYNRYGFTRHYYVVDISQHRHFIALFAALRALGHEWAGAMRHVRFGRIRGLSSRRGTAVFLRDLLDDGRDQMMRHQAETDSTRVSGAEAVTAADQVALSAVVVADLRNRRHQDYAFQWQGALRNTGDTGVSLQYCHCRLVSLEENCGVRLNTEADATTLTRQPTALQLMIDIARFDQVLYDFYQDLEPCVLVVYLLRLRTSINAAFNVLTVRNATPAEAESRLLLFVAARHTLAAGLRILGLRPLNKM